MILELVKNDNPFLKQKVELFDFGNPLIDPTELSVNLYETLMSSNYIGLAAPQVGLPYRAFALRAQPGIVCFNPRIVDVSEEIVMLDEVCLSFPALTLPIKRPKKIKVRYAEPNGIIKTATFDGMTARYFLHELDHLDGVMYTEKANKFHLDRALRKQTQTLRQAKAKNLL
jgi:peptide deformylase